MGVERETFWNITAASQVWLYVFFAISALIFFYGFYRRFKLWQMGVREKIKLMDMKQNAAYFINLVVKQSKVQREKWMGSLHRLISYGFSVLFIGTVLVFIDYDMGIFLLHGNFYLIYEFVLDVFGLLFIIGLLFILFTRKTGKLARLKKKPADQAFLWLLVFIGIGGFILEGIRISATGTSYGHWSPIGYLVALAVHNSFLLNAQTYLFWWMSHALLVFVLIALIPYTKLFHIFTAPIHILINPTKRTGTFSSAYENLKSLSITKIKEVNQIKDFSNLQLLSTDACTECGRCDSLCPAHLTGKPLSPRNIILKVRDNMGKKDKVADFVSSEELNACTTCGACVEVCPVSINHIDMILSMRRGMLASMEGTEQAQDVLMNLENDRNIWGKPWSERADWAKGLNVPVLHDIRGKREAK